ncbi:hypothetical protein AVEN_70947-1 [Araneus ventricosus]|uniref:Uncharacterized protein n=1 Tax=Araneus ventricosus TaxID=182803 RepID=A0A4Y2NM59_ARAVE|nr:hypothetical protein AVEN_70947-1 [Araneus ventricosus]
MDSGPPKCARKGREKKSKLVIDATRSNRRDVEVNIELAQLRHRNLIHVITVALAECSFVWFMKMAFLTPGMKQRSLLKYGAERTTKKSK